MAVSITTVEDNLRNAVLQMGTNDRVIFIAPNGPRPKLPYTCIQYVLTKPHAFDYTIFDKTSELNSLYGPRELLFTIICYGDNAIDEAARLNSAFSFSTAGEVLNSPGDASMAVQNVLNIDYQNVLHDDVYEKTAFFDIILNVVMEDGSTTEDTGYFDEVSNPTWSNKDDLT